MHGREEEPAIHIIANSGHYILGLDDPNEEGIFNPEFGKQRERGVYTQIKGLTVAIDGRLPSDGEWRDEFIRLHGEEL